MWAEDAQKPNWDKEGTVQTAMSFSEFRKYEWSKWNKWFFSKQICSEPKIKHMPRAFVTPKKKKKRKRKKPILTQKGRGHGVDRGITEVWFNTKYILKQTLRTCRMCFVLSKRMGGGGRRPLWISLIHLWLKVSQNRFLKEVLKRAWKKYLKTVFLIKRLYAKCIKNT